MKLAATLAILLALALAAWALYDERTRYRGWAEAVVYE